MSLPFGYRIIGVLCVLLGLLGSMFSALLTFALVSNVHVRTLNNTLSAVVLGFCGICSLLAGVCLFLNSHAAWQRARSVLRYSAFGFIALVLLGIHAMVMEYELLEVARKVDRNDKEMGIVRPSIATESVERNIDSGKYLIAGLALWVLVLSETAGRLGQHLPPRREENAPPGEGSDSAPGSMVPQQPSES